MNGGIVRRPGTSVNPTPSQCKNSQSTKLVNAAEHPISLPANQVTLDNLVKPLLNPPLLIHLRIRLSLSISSPNRFKQLPLQLLSCRDRGLPSRFTITFVLTLEVLRRDDSGSIGDRGHGFGGETEAVACGCGEGRGRGLGFGFRLAHALGFCRGTGAGFGFCISEGVRGGLMGVYWRGGDGGETYP
jgi:hypothetical protein